jgi:hypothetical protein
MIGSFGEPDAPIRTANCPKCGLPVAEACLDEHYRTHISEILPWLFLGNSVNAANHAEIIERNGIRYIVN